MHSVPASMSGTLTFVDAALGLAFAAVIAMLVSISRQRRRQAHEAWTADAILVDGIVASVRESGDVDTATTYTPEIVYRVDGQEFTIDGASSYTARFEAGARVPLAYKPELPGSARVVTIDGTSGFERTMEVVAFLLVALIATVASALVRS